MWCVGGQWPLNLQKKLENKSNSNNPIDKLKP